jgi:hypothetical protein
MHANLFMLILLLGSARFSTGQPESVPMPDPQNQSAKPDTKEVESARWAEQREEVVDAVGRTLDRRAYTMGVDFSMWGKRAAEARERLDQARTPSQLASEVNRVLASFGISHVKLKAPSETTGDKAPGSRQPEESPVSAPSRDNQTLTWEPGDLAVLKIRSFDDDRYSRQAIEGFVDEIRPRAKGIVLDLRNNGGGAVTAMSHLLGIFLERGTVLGVYVSRDIAAAYERTHSIPPATAAEAAEWTDRKFRVRRNAREPLVLPIAVLVSRSSASASEIVAAALRDHANAAILGQPSAGKVLLSVHAKLPHGFELQFPTADYVTSKGVRLEGSPIRPHILIPGGRGIGTKAAVQAASELLLEGL